MNHFASKRPISLLSTILLMILVLPCASAETPATSSKFLINNQTTSKNLKKVFIPISELETILQQDKQGVLLTQTEFDKLLTEINNKEDNPDQLPAGIFVRGVAYTAKIINKQLVISATMQLQQYEEDWQSLLLPFANVSLEKATLDGKPAQLGRDNKHPQQLILFSNKTGKTTLVLELSTPLGTIGSDNVAAFQLAGTASGIFSLSLPAGKHLFVDGLNVLRPAPVDQPANYQISVGGKQNIQLRISDEQKEQTTDSLLFASSQHGIFAAPGEVTWHAKTTLQVYGKRLDQLTFEIPKTLEIMSVDSTGLDMWELAESEKNKEKTALTLRYRQPFNGSREVLFRGIMTTSPKTPWQVPALVLSNVTSHVGQVLINKPTGIRLKQNKNEGTRQVNVSGKKQAGFMAFDIWQEDFILQFETQSRHRELHAALTTLVDINRQGLDLQLSATFETLFEPVFRLEMTMPAEWTMSEVQLNNKKVQWQTVPQKAGTHQIQVTLPTPLLPGQKQTFSLKGHRDLEQWTPETKPVDFDLPEIIFPQVNLVEGTYAIRTDETFKVIPLETEELEPAMLSLPGIALGWRYQDFNYSGILEISQKPQRISAQTLSTTQLDPQAIRSTIQVILDVSGSGIQSVQIGLPDEIQSDLRFDVVSGTARIVEQQAAKPRLNEQIWTLQFDRRFRGKVQLMAELTTPRKRDKKKGQTYHLPRIRVIGAERQNGFLAVVAQEEQQLTIHAKNQQGESLRPIDPADFPIAVQSATGRMIAAYRYLAPGYDVTLQETEYDRVAVPTAICQLGNHQTQLDTSGVLQHRFEYQFQAVGVQSLQVQLPSGLELWSVLLGGKPIEIRQNQNLLQIPLTGQSASKIEYALTLIASSQQQPLHAGGSIIESPPQLSILDGSGMQQPLEVLEQKWKVHHPQQTIITASNGLFHPTTALPRQGWLNKLRESFRFVPTVQLWVHGMMVLVVVLLIIIFIRAFQRWRYIGLMGVSGVAGLFLVLSFALWLISPAVRSTQESMTSYQSVPGAAKQTNEAFDRVEMEELKHDSAHSFGHGKLAGEKKEPAEDSNDPFQPKPADMPKSKKASPPKSTEPAQKGDGEGDSEGAGEDLNKKASEKAKPNLPPASAPVQGGKQENGKQQKGGFYYRSKPNRGARLSVPVKFQPSVETNFLTFYHIGAETEDEAALQLQYVNKQSTTILFYVVFAGTLLFFWLVRHLGWKPLTFCCIVGFVLPLALFTFMQGCYIAVLDGLFFGTLTAVLFLALWRTVGVVRQMLFSSTDKAVTQSVAPTLLFLFCLLVTSQNLSAQKRSQQKNSVRSGPVTTNVKPRHKEDRIYYAYEQGEDPLAAKQVFVPYHIYRKMWDKAYPQKRIKTKAPVKGIVTAATYSASFTERSSEKVDRMRVNGRIVLYSFRSSRMTLAIPLGDVSIQSALLDGKQGVLVANRQQKNQPLSIVITSPGLHILDVVFDVAVKTNGEAGELTLPFHAVPSGQFSLTLLQTNLEIRVNGNREAFRQQTDEKKTTVTIPVDQGGKLNIAWQPKQSNGGTNATIHSESTSLLNVDDQGISIKSNYQFRVHQGAMKEILFEFPDAIKLRHVTGRDVSGWEIAKAGNRRTLRVFLRRAVTNKTSLSFDQFVVHEITQKQNDFLLPQFYPLQVARDVGKFGIMTKRHFVVQGKAFKGASQIDLSQFRPARGMKIDNNHVLKLAYRTIARPFELSLKLSRRKAEKIAKAEHLLMVGRRKIHIGSKFVIQSKEVPQSRFVFNLPSEFLLLHVKGTGLRDWYVVEGQKRNRPRKLVIELQKPLIGKVDVLLGGTIPYESEEEELTIAAPVITEIDQLKSELVVQLDQTIKAKVFDEGDWKSLNSQQVATWLCKQGHRGQFAFRSNKTLPGEIEFELSQPEAKFSADVVTLISVTDTFQHFSINMKWNIQQGSRETLSFLTSPRFKDRLDIQGEGIRHVIAEETNTKQIRWTIFLHRPQQKEFFLTATATLPPANGNVVTSPAITVEGVLNFEEEIVTSTEVKQWHDIVIVNQSHFQLNRAIENKAEVIDAEMLPVSVSKSLLDQAVEIVRIPEKGKSVQWQIKRLTRQQSAKAIVNYANLITVLSRDGSWKSKVTYNVRNRSRQFLPILLPPQSRLLSVFVQGKPRRPSTTTFTSTEQATNKQQEQVLLIPLPHSSYVDPAFDVQLVVAGRLASGALPQGFKITGQTIDLPQIHVYSTTKNKEFGVTVLQTHWTVHVPKEFDTSVIDDQTRSNLEESTPQKSTLYQLQSLSREIDDLGSLSSVNSSRSQNQRALQNLKQIETSINRPKHDKWNSKLSIVLDSSQSMKKHELLNKKLQLLQENLTQQLKDQAEDRQDETGLTDLRSYSEREQKLKLGEQSRRQYLENRTTKSQTDGIFEDEKVSQSLQKRLQEISQSNKQLKSRFESSFSPAGKTSGSGFGGMGGSMGSATDNKENNFRQQQRFQSELQLKTITGKKGVQTEGTLPSAYYLRDDVGFFSATKRQSRRSLTVDEQRHQTGSIQAIKRRGQDHKSWSSAGGLSLNINIPTDGNVLTFSKTHGEARLALTLRPQKIRSSSLELLWSLIWLMGGIALLWVISKTTSPVQLFKLLPIVFAVLGLLAFFTLPVTIGWVGYLMFCIGAIAMGVQRVRINAKSETQNAT